MELFIMMIILIGLIFLGLPISYSIGASGLVFFLSKHPEMVHIFPQRLWAGADNFVIIALPLFIMAGELMNKGGITKRIVDLASLVVRPFRGGLAEVNIVASMIFGGISGSSVADTSALGSTLIPEMKRKGYPLNFSAGVTVASSTMGQIIPPSIPMLMYALASGASVGKLFLAGIIPGLLVGLTQIALVYFISEKKGYHKFSAGQETLQMRSIIEALVAFTMPVFIVVSISFGIVTATESAGLAVLYAMVAGFFVFKELKLIDLIDALKKTVIITSSVMMIIAFMMIFSYILAIEQVPTAIGQWMVSLNIGVVPFLLIFIILLLIAGTFLDVTPSIMLLTPIFLPIAASYGLSDIHFGLILVIGCGIGLVTPPVGQCLNAGVKVCGLPMQKIFKSALPILICNVIVLLLVAFIPSLTEFIPSLLM